MSYQLGSADLDGRAELYAEPRDQVARPRFRTLAVGLAALIVMTVFAGGLWFAYRQGLRHGGAISGAVDVPLIRADERPIKVKPEKPGGMEVPDRDKLIYTQKRATVEHLLPPPEKPIPRLLATPAGLHPEPGQPASGAAAPAGTAAATQSQPPGKPLPTAPASPKSPSAQKTAAARIQLASVHSEQAARQEWERIKRANPDLLASISAAPVRTDLGDKGVAYRLQTAPIADADRICGELKRRNFGCLVAR